ncbi:tRNA (adenosine(37)-N6)-threonylcarbamoyltransferase complex ATPase subunit type 1 TsaE [Chryseolinea sp. H1M3-3]|uniref:tRNA (adenosine(37)-N6)-threonylcarbamoyltransferase complex ATPase subunit type 1 TsaE n=1 Tax=Chryseolinea sp. H1M3-3 TaxID=3034144 RepID=UPI0023ED8FA4|nr:tRNA (adenosine(37)-N6)-threonylcarbamoyltransferase complex ATPase subunit type 1 TsaE [Chryseolinea sp. H1M3-3]
MTRDNGVFRSVTESDMMLVAKEIVRRINDIRVWLFHGEMGSGKTTLIKLVCKILGVTEGMSSPTFSIVNEYQTISKEKIYHFDFYRIRNEVEAMDIGTEEYFYSGDPCFIEWPEKIPSLIPSRYAEVKIELESNTQRTIAIAVHDGKEENRI